jgi:hypothetical protein
MAEKPVKASKRKGGKSPLLGAAVLKALLLRNPEAGSDTERELYRGVLRDLALTDAEVDDYLDEHRAEVEEAIRAHGRHSD